MFDKEDLQNILNTRYQILEFLYQKMLTSDCGVAESTLTNKFGEYAPQALRTLKILNHIEHKKGYAIRIKKAGVIAVEQEFKDV